MISEEEITEAFSRWLNRFVGLTNTDYNKALDILQKEIANLIKCETECGNREDKWEE